MHTESLLALRARQEELHAQFLTSLTLLEEKMIAFEAHRDNTENAARQRELAVNVRVQSLNDREMLLARREEQVASIREMAATRLAANKVLQGQLNAAVAESKAARKELSDLKSKLRNPQNKAFAAELAQVLADGQ